MMSGEVAHLSHKAKRVLLGSPRQTTPGYQAQMGAALFGTDHHVVSIRSILDARDDMNRLAGGFGGATELGEEGAGLGGRCARLLWRSRRGGRLDRARLEQEAEIRDLLLEAAICACKAESCSGKASREGDSGAGDAASGSRDGQGRKTSDCADADGQAAAGAHPDPFFACIRGWRCKGN